MMYYHQAIFDWYQLIFRRKLYNLSITTLLLRDVHEDLLVVNFVRNFYVTRLKLTAMVIFIKCISIFNIQEKKGPKLIKITHK